MPHVSIKPDLLGHLFGLPITNTLLTSWIVMAVLLILAYIIGSHIEDVPKKLQNGTEAVIAWFVDFLAMIAGSEQSARKHFPLIATVFFFIVTANWMGIFPGIGSIGFHEAHGAESVLVPFFRSVNSDLNMTLAIALIVVTVSHVVGVSTLGALRHAGKFFSFKNPMQFFVGILELVSEFAKIVSFSFRLFGNIFAGEVLLVIMSFLVPFLVPIPFLGLELFVGIIQAAIFAVLGMMFIAAAEQLPEH